MNRVGPSDRPVLEVRVYRGEDQEAVVGLWWDSWHSIRPGLRHPQPLSEWRRRWADEIVPDQAIVIAEDEGAVVGYAAADIAASVLTQIFVAPGYKRRGIGRELLAWAQRSMPGGFSLRTLADNLTARAFYDHHGLVAGDRCISEVNGMETIEYCWVPLPASHFTAGPDPRDATQAERHGGRQRRV